MLIKFKVMDFTSEDVSLAESTGSIYTLIMIFPNSDIRQHVVRCATDAINAMKWQLMKKGYKVRDVVQKLDIKVYTIKNFLCVFIHL